MKNDLSRFIQYPFIKPLINVEETDSVSNQKEILIGGINEQMSLLFLKKDPEAMLSVYTFISDFISVEILKHINETLEFNSKKIMLKKKTEFELKDLRRLLGKKKCSIVMNPDLFSKLISDNSNHIEKYSVSGNEENLFSLRGKLNNLYDIFVCPYIYSNEILKFSRDILDKGILLKYNLKDFETKQLTTSLEPPTYALLILLNYEIIFNDFQTKIAKYRIK